MELFGSIIMGVRGHANSQTDDSQTSQFRHVDDSLRDVLQISGTICR